MRTATPPPTTSRYREILAENGRDIEAAKKPFADYESVKEQLKTAKEGLKAFEGVSVEDLPGKINTLTGQLADKDKAWQAKLDGTDLELAVKQDEIRTRREKECYSVINRGQLWYEGISLARLAELRQWYKAWRDAPATLIIPDKPAWLD